MSRLDRLPTGISFYKAKKKKKVADDLTGIYAATRRHDYERMLWQKQQLDNYRKKNKKKK